MVKDLSPAELSALWLLHDRHTNRRAVEKAIELGLPLWTEAVHLARACHRSNMDLAGGAYYMVGSDFVDNEDSSQYDYHEKGRYPDAYADNASRIAQEREKERSASNRDARTRFESEKSKHIQLLLGGVSSAELENLQSERSSLEICEISDDEESIGARSHAGASKTPKSGNTTSLRNKPHAASSTQTIGGQPTNEKSLSQEENSSLTTASTGTQAKPGANKNRRKEQEFRCDLSFYEAQMLRSCEAPATSTTTRNLVLMDRAEFERRLKSENESIKEEKKSPPTKNSTLGDSEIEDSRRNTVMEIETAVSQLAPDLEMNEVISKLMKEDVAAEFSEAGTPTKRSKRHYVEPFDGDASVSESEFSDTNIDVNILYEISELRREEGASSPSCCSIDSDDVIPPDVCIWHPQSCTYNIDLITYFRAPSPSEETAAVLIPKEFVELALKAPVYEEIGTTVSFSKHLPHSGAFARKRGRRVAARSLSLPAAKTENVVLDCALKKSELGNETCELEIIRSSLESMSLACKAAREERCLLDSSVINKNEEALECLVRREDRQTCSTHLETKSASLDSCAMQYDFQNSADVAQLCEVKCNDYRRETVFFNAKASTSADATCNVPFSSEPLGGAHTFCVAERQRLETSIVCKAPRSAEISSAHGLLRKALEKESCSVTLDDLQLERAMLQCSVPKHEAICSYWVFDIMLGNSAVIVRKDKNMQKAVHFCKAIPCKKPTVPTDEETLGRTRDDSLDEVLMLLETGAMPSQFIETPPPKMGVSLESHVLEQGRLPGEIGASAQHHEVVVISPKKRPPSLNQSPSNLEKRPSIPFSDGSGLSDSPDRLVICDDEDVLTHEDPVKVVENLNEVLSHVADTVPQSIAPSVSGEIKAKKALPEVTGDEPARKASRKRSTANEIAAVRKRSAGKLDRDTSNAELPHSSTKGKQTAGVVPVVDVAATVKKARKVAEKIPAQPALSLPKTVPKKVAKHAAESTGKRRSAKFVQPAAEDYVAVCRKAAMPSIPGLSIAGVSSEGSSAACEKKPRRKTGHYLGSPLTVPEPASLSTRLPTPKSSRAAEKRKSPIFESHSTEITAAFVAAPQTASAVVQLPVSNKQCASFECFACLSHEPESRLMEPILDTGLDDVTEFVISAVPDPTSSISKGPFRTDDAQTSVADISTSGRRGRRKGGCAAGASSTKPKRSVDKAETIIASDKRRKSKRLSELPAPEETPKRRKTASSAGLESHVIPTREKVAAGAIHTETLHKEGLFESTSKSKSAALAEKGKLAQAKATPRSSKRRRTTLPDLPPSSNGCIADATKRRHVPELELDTDVVLRATKRRKTIATERVGRNAASMVDSAVDNDEVQLEIPPRRKAGRLTTVHPAVAASSSQAEPRRRTTATCSSASVQRTSDEDEVQFVESGFAHRRRRSLTPPILVVAVDFTSSFVPIKRDNNRCAEPITLPACNRGEAVSLAIYSSDTAEVLNALALDIIIGEASALSAVNLATFAHFVLNLFDPVGPIFAPLEDIEPSTLPPNFTTIFERATPLQYRHRLDYNSFNTMLLNRLPENGLHALTLDSRRVSMLKITKFVDTIKEAVEDICEELRNRKNLSKSEIKKEIDLSGEVQQLITSRYVETMMKMADACGAARDVPLVVIADRFHLLLCGWQCFLQQGGVLRVRVQICPGRSHPGIVDITTAWLDKIDTVLSRAQATKSMRTAAFAVSLAQEKTIISKVWYQMASHTSNSNEDGTYIFCEECKLYFRNEDTDFIHNRVFHQKSRECEECYDMFHTLLGLDLHMVGCHKRNFAVDL